MIPVTPQPEPANFDAKVRQPGKRWVARQGLDPSQPVPSGTELKPYWTECLPQLAELYGHVCAYVCLYIPKITGSPSVEHFVPKSRQLSLAYEWSNYRLVCAKMNSRKRDYSDVLDPFTLQAGTFVLNLQDGSISPSPGLSAALKQRAEATIDRLDLDDVECRQQRLEHFDAYKQGDVSEAYFKRRAPFVWVEAQRLGRL
jgi:uncharacterized protein (TIGR02646 family)